MINSAQENLALRYKFPEFIYESYSFYRNADGVKVDYVYKLGPYTFTPSVEIPAADIRNDELDDEFLSYLFFNFGIINAIHYYKLSIPATFHIKAGSIDNAQKEFFHKLFFGELIEFLYDNNLRIPYEEFITFICDNQDEPHNTYHIDTKFEGNLIPVGGNKNSVVVLEGLQEKHEQNLCFLYHYGDDADVAATDCIKEAGYGLESVVDFNLTLDPQIDELPQQGFYNGHVSLSSCFAFASYITAYLNKKENIILSNSAFDGNNHQYTKSFDFETNFQHYIDTYFAPKIHYFSILRGMNDYAIYQKFIKHPLYLKAFGGCSNTSEEKRWCGHCPRCLYNYIMLYPLEGHDKLLEIFGEDLLNDQRLTATFTNLVNYGGSNPFDFIGTREEIIYSLQLACAQLQPGEKAPLLLQYFHDYLNNPNQVYNVTSFYNPAHHIPQEYLDLIYKS